MTLNVLKRRPDHRARASAMKSQLRCWLDSHERSKGRLMRAGSRFLPRPGRLSLRSQYTRHITVMPQGLALVASTVVDQAEAVPRIHRNVVFEKLDHPDSSRATAL